MLLTTRRSLLVGGGASLLVAAPALHLAQSDQDSGYMVTRYEPLPDQEFAGKALGEFPGDFEYMHKHYHIPWYQKVFGEIGKCSCGTGDCRVTDWRETKLGSPKGYDVIVLRHWVAVPKGTWIPRRDQIPKELCTEKAHVCAYGPITAMALPCLIINETKV